MAIAHVQPADGPDVEIVIPVYNEQDDLSRSVLRCGRREHGHDTGRECGRRSGCLRDLDDAAPGRVALLLGRARARRGWSVSHTPHEIAPVEDDRVAHRRAS